LAKWGAAHAVEDDHAGGIFRRACFLLLCRVRSKKNRKKLQDRPDLVVSELSGLAFDSLRTAFRPADLDIMFSQTPPEPRNSEALYMAIDPAAGMF
jgi:hypothetical protein